MTRPADAQIDVGICGTILSISNVAGPTLYPFIIPLLRVFLCHCVG